ncbi:MAG: hypothetical protein GWN94_27010 [Phycisphaerae bacterium]|nr:hypothetical protein [Phycisphaerae bacterium]
MVFVKAYLALKDFEEAEGNAQSAYEKAVSMKYRWAEIKTGSLPKTCMDSGCSGFVGADFLGQG